MEHPSEFQWHLLHVGKLGEVLERIFESIHCVIGQVLSSKRGDLITVRYARRACDDRGAHSRQGYNEYRQAYKYRWRSPRYYAISPVSPSLLQYFNVENITPKVIFRYGHQEKPKSRIPPNSSKFDGMWGDSLEFWLASRIPSNSHRFYRIWVNMVYSVAPANWGMSDIASLALEQAYSRMNWLWGKVIEVYICLITSTTASV